jgi:hypothetical protein
VSASTHPALLNYFLQDDIYLLPADRAAYAQPQPALSCQDHHEPSNAEPMVVDEPVLEKVTKDITFKYLGGNQKNFLVLTFYSDIEHIANDHLTALINTLSRIGHVQADIAILNLAKHNEVTWENITGYFTPLKLLILGSKAAPKGLPALEMNKLIKSDQLTALLTFSFEEMMNSNDNKKIFWNQVKTF